MYRRPQPEWDVVTSKDVVAHEGTNEKRAKCVVDIILPRDESLQMSLRPDSIHQQPTIRFETSTMHP